VNCAMGKSRSVSLVMAYFIKCCGFSYEEALRLCKSRRSISQPNNNFERQLRALETDVRRSNRNGNTSSNSTPQSPLNFSPSLKLPSSPSTQIPPSSSSPYWSSASRARSPLPSRDYDVPKYSPPQRDWEPSSLKLNSDPDNYYTNRLRDEYGLSSPRSYSRYDVPRTSLADPLFPSTPVTGRSSYPSSSPNPYSPSTTFGANRDYFSRALSPSRNRNVLLDKLDSRPSGPNDFVSRRLSL
jgi:hypothetical protein